MEHFFIAIGFTSVLLLATSYLNDYSEYPLFSEKKRKFFHFLKIYFAIALPLVLLVCLLLKTEYSVDYVAGYVLFLLFHRKVGDRL